MKRTAFLAGAILVTITMTACSKSYNCHCVYKDNGTVTHEDDHKISEGSESKSAASCDKMDATTTSTLNGNTYTSTTECELK